MTWFDLTVASLAATAILFIPGYLLALVLRLRGVFAVALAAPFSMTVITAAATLSPALGVSWSLVPVLTTTLVLAGVLYVFRRFILLQPIARDVAWRPGAWFWATLVIAAGLIAWRVASVIGTPDGISQTFDNVFHLNAVRYVMDTGNASSFHIGSLTSANLTFYPASWHSLVALVVPAAKGSIPLAINAVVIVTSALVWPSGILLLTRVLFGHAPALQVSAGILSAAIPAFPLLMIDYGVLYPYHLAIALVAPAVAVSIVLVKAATARVRGSWFWWFVALAGTLPGIAVTHPGGFMTWLALSVPIAVVGYVSYIRAPRTAASPRRRLVITATVGLVAYLAVGYVLLRELRPPAEARQWHTYLTVGEAALDTVTLSVYDARIAVVAAALMLVGIVIALVRPRPSTVIAVLLFVVLATLYVFVTSVEPQDLRDILTGPWYNNAPRLAALLPIAAVPLGAFGASWVCGRVVAIVRGRADGASRRGVLVPAAVVGAAALIVSTQTIVMDTATEEAAVNYAVTDTSPLLSPDELALIARIPDEVPADATIAGNPWTGAQIVYALTGNPVLMPHLLMDVSDEVELVNEDLDEATPGSAVCDAIEDLDVEYILDFPGVTLHNKNGYFPSYDDLADSDAVELVDQQGAARLYRVIACG